MGKKNFKVFSYPYGAYTPETVWVLRLNGVNWQVYDLGINSFRDFNTSYVKRLNIPCEMTGREILEEIKN